MYTTVRKEIHMTMRAQANLGEVSKEVRRDLNMGGVLLFGKVLKVYHKHHTADVQILNNQYGTIVSSDQNEGKYACKILESYAGFDSNLNVSFGSITPIQEGCPVVVGFLNNYKSQPIILGCFHESESSQNILPGEYPLDQDTEVYRRTIITRLQDYFTINSLGEFELAHHSGAFISSSIEDIDDEKYNWDNLQLSQGKKKISMSSSSNPLNILASIRTFFGSLRLFLKGSTGEVRLSKYNNIDKKLSFVEINELGSIRLKSQMDTSDRDKSSDYSEILMNLKTGDIEINQTSSGHSNRIVLQKNNGIIISSTSGVVIDQASQVSINSDTEITLNSRDINLSLFDDEED